MTAVLFHSDGSDNGVPYYRDRLPGAALRRMGYTVWMKPVLCQEAVSLRLRGGDALSSDAMAIMQMRGSVPVINPSPVPKIVLDHTGRDVLGPNSIADNVPMYSSARERGQRVFVDLDDDVWQLPPWNPAAQHYDADSLLTIECNLNAANGVLCSTPPLAEQVAKHCPDAPVFLCPNAIDPTLYKPSPEHDPLRVGWLGMTDWRVGDLATIAEPLKAALQGRNVEFYQLGWERHRLPVRGVLGEDFPVPVVERPWVPMSKLPESLRQIDLAVVPMDDIPINASRSATTGLALAAAGIPFVASPSPAYLELAAAGAGILAGSDDDWIAQLTYLIETPSWRSTVADRGMVAARTRYRPDDLCKAWDKAFRSVR